LGWLPAWHWLPEQQPAQFCGPHVGVLWHDPPTHVSFALQLRHWPPKAPHAWFVGGLMHVLPRQHPAQFCGPHVGVGTQTLPPGVCWHDWPTCVQFWQDDPRLPHAVLSTPMRHVLPRQQPAQFCGLHDGVPVH
jgi:hypothetical protein